MLTRFLSLCWQRHFRRLPEQSLWPLSMEQPESEISSAARCCAVTGPGAPLPTSGIWAWLSGCRASTDKAKRSIRFVTLCMGLLSTSEDKQKLRQRRSDAASKPISSPKGEPARPALTSGRRGYD
jgi:hypothetical protein